MGPTALALLGLTISVHLSHKVSELFRYFGLEKSQMESFIESKVERMKDKIFKNFDPYPFVFPSAYDTAWLALIPDSNKSCQPMFKNCLAWLLNNQKQLGFWGDSDAFGKPTIESLPATLASMAALKKWNTGISLIEKGLSFIEENAEQLLKDMNQCPRWFSIIFPATIELAEAAGLHVVFPETVKEMISNIFCSKRNILDKEELVGKQFFPPLLSYLEALPPSYALTEEVIFSNLSGDGSLFQSPSATAKAFMATGKPECLAYLQSLAQRCPNGVPQAYPMDEDLIKLFVVNQLHKLGLAEHFVEEIEEIISEVYRSYMEVESWVKPSNMIAAQLHKDSLAFQLLRTHGFNMSSSRVSWILHHQEIRGYVEKDYESFSSAILNIYRASNLIFLGEYELGQVRSFSRKLLEKTLPADNGDRPHVKLSKFNKMIEHELSHPWLARLDHLEHRMWIEANEVNALWEGKASYNRISPIYNDQMLELGRANYDFRQSIYKNEMEEINRWSKLWGLSDMGFGREKTAYCYFAIAASTSLPSHSYVRMLVAKSAIIITVADDFFDMEGSLPELEDLTDAIGRWDPKGLNCYSKVIFDALDNLVSEAATKYLQQEGTDITNSLRDLWYETFISWLIEARWSKSGYTPSIDDYLKNGMTSIANHTIVLPAACFLKPSLPNHKLRPPQYESITNLLMLVSRLLNDLQSYQKEKEEGKKNSVLLNLIEHPESNIEDAIAYVGEIIEKKKKELLEHALIDGLSDLPKPCRHLHLSCLKVFQMFFNSSNRFDSDTELLHDINKAIYLPVSGRTSKALKVLSLHSVPKKKCTTPIPYSNICRFKDYSGSSFTAHKVSQIALRNGFGLKGIAQKGILCFP